MQHTAVAEAEGFPCLTSWCRFPSSTCSLLMMLSPTNTMLSYCCHQWDCQSKGPIGLSTNDTIRAPIIAEQPGLLAFLRCIISADDEQPKVGAKRRAHPLIASDIVCGTDGWVNPILQKVGLVVSPIAFSRIWYDIFWRPGHVTTNTARQIGALRHPSRPGSLYQEDMSHIPSRELGAMSSDAALCVPER